MMVPRNTTTSKEDSNIMFTLHFTHLTAVQFLRMRNDVLWRIASESTVLACVYTCNVLSQQTDHEG